MVYILHDWNLAIECWYSICWQFGHISEPYMRKEPQSPQT